MPKRPSLPHMTKYEFTRILAARSQQLSEGAPSTLDHTLTSGRSPLDIAIQELEQGIIPMKILRVLPDGEEETWRVRDLTIPHAMLMHAKSLGL